MLRVCDKPVRDDFESLFVAVLYKWYAPACVTLEPVVLPMCAVDFIIRSVPKQNLPLLLYSLQNVDNYSQKFVRVNFPTSSEFSPRISTFSPWVTWND